MHIQSTTRFHADEFLSYKLVPEQTLWVEPADAGDTNCAKFGPVSIRLREGLPTIRPRQRTRSLLSVRGAIGLDVLVESQHVVWVVLFLDLHEASIVRPIARADQLVTRISQLVDVHSMREGL